MIQFEFRHDIFGMRKLESWAIVRRYLLRYIDATFRRFETIPECDRHPETQTHDDGIASRGKN